MFTGKGTRRADPGDALGVRTPGADGVENPAEEPARSALATATPEVEGNGPAEDAGRAAAISRRDVYGRPMVAGRPVSETSPQKLIYSLRRRVSTELERREEELDTRLRRLAGVSRANTIAVISPKGGVGKTTTSFLIGDLLSSALKLRVVAVDANPDFGTLASLAPDDARSAHSMADLLEQSPQVDSAAELRRYISHLPSGLHLLGTPAEAELMEELTPERYRDLLQLLRRYYDVVILDLGTGITDPLAHFAIEQADQNVVVSTPDWVTSRTVLDALGYLNLDRATLVLNQAPRARRHTGSREEIESTFARRAISTRVTIPYDERLRTMLDSGSYDLAALDRAIRVPIKELGLTVGQWLM
jgi:MinD-like ATPase involved in chromosome partitioning or flagellar assembly